MKKLLRKLRGLEARAAAKLAELNDDTAADAARAIEAQHQAILDEITTLRSEIDRLAGAEEDDDTDDDNSNRQRTGGADDLTTRAAEIVGIAALARRQGVELTTEEEQTAIRSGASPQAFRAQLFDRLAEHSRSTQTSPRAQVGQDDIETRRSAQIEALAYRFGAPMPQAGPSQQARQYMERGLVDIAADAVNFRGGRMLNARQVDDLFSRAGSLSTSDFPIIFEGAINRTLEGRYALAQPTYRRIARQRNFRDFRPASVVKVGDFPLLQPVLETGEIKYGAFKEGKETVQAFSYAIALRVSRNMLINDDIGAIADMLSSYGDTVALFEEITFYSKAFNGNLADGKAVFHADHNNLAAAGTVIDVDNVGKGRAAMSKQKSIGDNPLLQNRARILLVGPDKLTEAEKLVASITPATVANVNIFSGRLEPIETGMIAGNAWHLFGDPATGSNYRWGYLDGYEAPRVRTDEPFGQQGFAMSVEHDFGVGATDFRFGWKNPGA